MPTRRFPLAVILFASALPAFANDGAIKRCRAVQDPAKRLACYDALPLGEAAPAPATPPAVAPGRAAPVPGQPSAALAPKPAPEGLEARFGLERQTPTVELPAIESFIPGPFMGWGPNYRIRLANGQVWQIADDSSRRLDLRDPKVTVRRAALGSFFLDFEGDNRSPRVKRVQ
jgi:hypothetical protein